MSRTSQSSFTVIATLSLVIFLLGLLGVLLINAAKLNNHIKENIQITVFFDSDLPSSEVRNLSDSILLQDYATKGVFTSSDDAAFNFKNEIGEDFVEILGDNPLPASLEISISREYTDNDRLVRLERQLSGVKGVLEVSYPQNVFRQIDENRRIISYWLLALSLILILVAVVLMSNTVRILIYSDRFLIKNQQLIGAKESFITKPYKKMALRWTLISFAIGTVLLVVIMWVIFSWLNVSMDLNMKAIQHHFAENWYQYILMLFLLFIAGVLVIYTATHFATKKYLHTNTDNIYT